MRMAQVGFHLVERIVRAFVIGENGVAELAAVGLE